MAANKNNKALNVPHLRFPEFTDEWKESVLSDFVERVKRKNKNNLCKLPLTISAQYGLVDQISFFNKVIASENMSNYYLLHKGDFAYNKSYSSEYPWGAIKRLDCYEQGTLSSLYICFKPYSHVSSDFLTHYFETSKWHHGISEIAVEGARNHGLLNVGIQDFFETKHCLPQSLLEQEKIAKFLNLIEERIATQNKIIKKLETLIKALSATVFNSLQGPLILLSKVASIKKGQQLNGTELEECGRYYVMNGGVVPSGYYDEYNTEANTISISEGGNSCGYVQFNTLPFWSGGHCYTLCDIKNEFINPKYLYHYLKYKEQNIMALRIGSGLPNIQKKALDRFGVKLPDMTIQNRIAIALDTITKKIDVENRIKKSYQVQKSYLLSNLFI